MPLLCTCYLGMRFHHQTVLAPLDDFRKQGCSEKPFGDNCNFGSCSSQQERQGLPGTVCWEPVTVRPAPYHTGCSPPLKSLSVTIVSALVPPVASWEGCKLTDFQFPTFTTIQKSISLSCSLHCCIRVLYFPTIRCSRKYCVIIDEPS